MGALGNGEHLRIASVGNNLAARGAKGHDEAGLG
jgi:hypothetical protein